MSMDDGPEVAALIEEQEEAAQAHREAAERFVQLRRTNAASQRTLTGRGSGVNAHAIMRERTELLFDLLMGMFDPDSPAEAKPIRLHAEVLWQERLRAILSRGLVETSGAPEADPEPELLVPKTDLFLPPGTKRH